MDNEVLLSPCTEAVNFESMKLDFIEAIKDLNNSGAKVKIVTEKEGDGFITCLTEVEHKNHGYGNFYGDVRFVNPESIINFILHCAGFTSVGSMGFGVKDLSSTEVEIELIKANKKTH